MILQEVSPHASRDIILPQDNIILKSNWFIHRGIAHQLMLESFRVDRAAEIARLYSSNRTFFELYDVDWVQYFDTPDKIISIILKRRNRSGFLFSILDQLGSLVGTCGFKISPDHTYAALEYHVDRDHTGNGYAGKSVAMLIDFAHTQRKIHHFVAYVHQDNRPSRKTVEKLGFAYYMHDENLPEFLTYELHK